MISLRPERSSGTLIACILLTSTALIAQEQPPGAPAALDTFSPAAHTNPAEIPAWPADWPPAGPRGCANCQPADLPENEPDCGVPDTFNAGCNGTPVRVIPLTCGQTVCGTGMIQLAPTLLRDTDWYSITLDQRRRLRWRVTPEWINGAHMWIMPSGCPTGMFTAGISFTCSSGSIFETLDPGTYYVMTAPAWTNQPTPCASYRAVLTCEDPPPAPANDTCAGALSLPCNQSQVYNNTNAGSGPEDFIPLTCSLSGTRCGLASVWFKFTASATSAVVSTCPPIPGGLIDPLLAVYRAADPSNPCNTLTEIGCSDDFCQGGAEVSLTGLTVGETYYVKIAGPGDSTADGPRSGQFNLRLTTECGPPCPDLDADGQTGLQDLTILLAHYGQTTGATFADGDLDADGDVDLSDLTNLLARYGQSCP
jgi:hypothetical protein